MIKYGDIRKISPFWRLPQREFIALNLTNYGWAGSILWPWLIRKKTIFQLLPPFARCLLQITLKMLSWFLASGKLSTSNHIKPQGLNQQFPLLIPLGFGANLELYFNTSEMECFCLRYSTKQINFQTANKYQQHQQKSPGQTQLQKITSTKRI